MTTTPDAPAPERPLSSMYSPEVEACAARILPLPWASCEGIDHGTSPMHPFGICAPTLFEVSHESGATFHLDKLHQSKIYSGWLAGMPRTPKDESFRAIEAALKLYPRHERDPYFVPPRLHRGQRHYKYADGRPDEFGNWELLPFVRCIGWFTGWHPERDADEKKSTVVMIWFQDHLGLPTDELTLSSMRSFEWEKFAKFWDW